MLVQAHTHIYALLLGHSEVLHCFLLLMRTCAQLKRESTNRTNMKHTQTIVPEPVELEKVEDEHVSYHAAEN